MPSAQFSVILIGGAGGQGRDVLDALLVSQTRVAGILEDPQAPPASTPSQIYGVPVIGRVEDWTRHVAPNTGFALAVVPPARRLAIAREILAAGGTLHTVIHPSASVSPRARIGSGSAVLAGCSVAPDAELGVAVILNSRCTIDHDCVLYDGVQFGPGVSLAGFVKIGECANVGVGACAMPGVQIGKNAVVGAGSVCIKNVEEGAVVAGNPAKPLPTRGVKGKV